MRLLHTDFFGGEKRMEHINWDADNIKMDLKGIICDGVS
jgi:hypothetical protein